MLLNGVSPNFTGKIRAVSKNITYQANNDDGTYKTRVFDTEQIRNIRKINKHKSMITVRETDEDARSRGASHPDYRDYLISSNSYNTVLSAYIAASLNKNIEIEIPEEC